MQPPGQAAKMLVCARDCSEAAVIATCHHWVHYQIKSNFIKFYFSKMDRIKYKRSKCIRNREGKHWDRERLQSTNICPPCTYK